MSELDQRRRIDELESQLSDIRELLTGSEQESPVALCRELLEHDTALVGEVERLKAELNAALADNTMFIGWLRSWAVVPVEQVASYVCSICAGEGNEIDEVEHGSDCMLSPARFPSRRRPAGPAETVRRGTKGDAECVLAGHKIAGLWRGPGATGRRTGSRRQGAGGEGRERMKRTHKELMFDAVIDMESLKARLATMAEALVPFAEVALWHDVYGYTWRDDHALDALGNILTIGDCRRAAKALEDGKEGAK